VNRPCWTAGVLLEKSAGWVVATLREGKPTAKLSQREVLLLRVKRVGDFYSLFYCDRKTTLWEIARRHKIVPINRFQCPNQRPERLSVIAIAPQAVLTQ
jgi:hypothetical protein